VKIECNEHPFELLWLVNYWGNYTWMSHLCIYISKIKKNSDNCEQMYCSCYILVYLVDRCLSFCTFSFGHCVVCSSLIYGFRLPLCIFKLFFHKNIWGYPFLNPQNCFYLLKICPNFLIIWMLTCTYMYMMLMVCCFWMFNKKKRSRKS
jgi:hypothetical protein